MYRRSRKRQDLLGKLGARGSWENTEGDRGEKERSRNIYIYVYLYTYIYINKTIKKTKKTSG